jgi:hypothetical protein
MCVFNSLALSYSRRDMDATSLEVSLCIVAKARDRNPLQSLGCVNVKGPLESILELVDHDLFDNPPYCVSFILEVSFAGEQIVKQGSESLVYVARSVETAYGVSTLN